MLTPDELRSEGFLCFEHIKRPALLRPDEPSYEAFEAIREKLGNADFVQRSIAGLEEAMWKGLRQKWHRRDRVPTKSVLQKGFDSRFDNEKVAFKHLNGASEEDDRLRDPLYERILSSVLKQTELENGFGAVSYAWGVHPSAFLINLKARRPFKDRSASIQLHGEYSHRIQWWIVCNFILPTSKDNARYYAECADWSCTVVHGGKVREVYLWDYLFDSAFNTTGLDDKEAAGRSPIEVFSECQNALKYPLLGAFMSYRVAKAMAIECKVLNSSDGLTANYSARLSGKFVSPGIMERAARQFLQRSFDSLSIGEKECIFQFINENGFTY